ncbi:MAG: hypothetical protein HY549_04675 [Elusimicrobia bacterium]|nr:hypothetical protein [Elusimicrobiota bacterium]
MRPAAATERIKIRGLVRIPSVLFGLWGTAVSLKALYDLLLGEPEANLYSSRKWEFITQEQWLRYGGFELAYGLACLGLAWALWRYSRFLPEHVERTRKPPEFELFG